MPSHQADQLQVEVGSRVDVQVAPGQSYRGTVEDIRAVYADTPFEFETILVALDLPMPGCVCGKCPVIDKICTLRSSLAPVLAS